MDERCILDVENEVHIAVLHFLCLPAINEDLLQFEQAWKQLRLSSEVKKTTLTAMVRQCPDLLQLEV